MGMDIPEFCDGCWQRHCWNGTYNSTLPNDFFQPSLVLNPTLTYAEFENSPEGVGEDAQGTPTATTGSSPKGTGSSPTGSATPKSEASQIGLGFSLVIAPIAAIYVMNYV